MAKNNLEKLYEIMANSQELGLALNEEVINQINEKEEEFIRTEVLPVLHEQIEPTLRPVKRKLVLVVEYDPEGQLQVKISRKVNITKMLSDAKTITAEPPAPEPIKRDHLNPRTVDNPITRLRITMPDGHVIQETYASRSFVRFVQLVGPERVRRLGMKVNRLPLLDTTQTPPYVSAQKPVGNGLYLNTCSDTPTKKHQIQAIARALGLDVKVEII